MAGSKAYALLQYNAVYVMFTNVAARSGEYVAGDKGIESTEAAGSKAYALLQNNAM